MKVRSWKNCMHKMMGAILIVISFCSVPICALAVTTDQLEYSLSIEEILTKDEIALMQEKEVYVVGYVSDFMPLCYLDEEGELSGTAIDVWEAISYELDINVKYVDLNYEGTDLDAVDISLVFFEDNNMLPMKESVSYYDTSYLLVQRIESENINLGSVGILEYFMLQDSEIQGMLGDVVQASYPIFDDMNAAYENREIQGMLLTSVRYNNVKNSISDDYTVEVLDEHYSCCLYYTELLSDEETRVIDELLDGIDDKNINYSILHHSTYEMGEVSLLEVLQENPVRIFQLFIVVVCLLLVVGATIVALLGRKNRRELEQRLNTDSLTGLCTIHYFEKELRRLLEEESEREFTIFSFDIDNFKYINEIYGYEIGTEVLKKLAAYMRVSTYQPEMIARTYADQFLVLAESQYITSSFLERFQEVLLKGFSGQEHGLGEDYQFSFSMGFYRITDHKSDVNYMINCARWAQGIGKKTVGCTINEFTLQMAMERGNNNHIVMTMEGGVKNKEFVVYYQPKIDLATNKIIGAEALVRWQRNGKLIAPYSFIPIFEKNGFIETLDYYVLEEVCRFIKRNEEKVMPIISVNLSAVTIMKKNLVNRIKETVEKRGVLPKQVDIEITESVLMERFHRVADKIQELRALGFTISMDDFGVGNSSLSHLKDIPFDTLKLDRSFVIDALRSKKGAVIATHIIQLAKDLQLGTVAEGIETGEQLEFFKDLECDIGQGYYYARPLPEEEFLELLDRSK